eukprot:6563504-Pyramimonas_sp.AAC.1
MSARDELDAATVKLNDVGNQVATIHLKELPVGSTKSVWINAIKSGPIATVLRGAAPDTSAEQRAFYQTL